MGFAVIGKLTDNLYIIKEGKNSIEAKDYIAYIWSLSFKSSNRDFINLFKPLLALALISLKLTAFIGFAFSKDLIYAM